MANGIRTGNLRRFNKGRSLKSNVGSRVRQTHIGGHIGRNVMEITIKMKTRVRKPLMIKIPPQVSFCIEESKLISSTVLNMRYKKPFDIVYCSWFSPKVFLGSDLNSSKILLSFLLLLLLLLGLLRMHLMFENTPFSGHK